MNVKGKGRELFLVRKVGRSIGDKLRIQGRNDKEKEQVLTVGRERSVVML